jgi:hypothetical protein
VTPNSPTAGDLEQFLIVDGWRRIPPGERGGRRESHVFYEKQLPDGRTLQTHVSHDRSATISAGRFGAILREQLEVSRADFWEAIRGGEPVDRPVATEEPEGVEHEAWVVEVLVGKLHMGPEEIEKLSEQAAIDLVHEFWSRSRP